MAQSQGLIYSSSLVTFPRGSMALMQGMWLQTKGNKSPIALAQFDDDAIVKMLIEWGENNVAIASMPVLSTSRQ